MRRIPSSNIIGKQIYFLRLLSSVSRDEIKVMVRPQSPWVNFHDILEHAPDRSIHSRLILRNELVLEMDSNDWAEVRDGTQRILSILDQWGAKGSYYLSFSGNRSIHVHVFMDMESLPAYPDIIPLLIGHDVIPSIKRFLTSQIATAAHAVVDPQLSGIHLIRMEGGFNEKSHRYCTMIRDIPENRPEYYDIEVPAKLPPKFWDLSIFVDSVNGWLKNRYKTKPARIVRAKGRPFDPEPLKDILKPVFIPGYRHFMVLAISGWLKRHGIPEHKALEIVRALNPHDATPAKTTNTVHEVYKAGPESKVAGLPYLLNIINGLALSGQIPANTARDVANALKALNRGTSEAAQ